MEQSTIFSESDYTFVGMIKDLSFEMGPQINSSPLCCRAMVPSLHWIFLMFFKVGIFVGAEYISVVSPRPS